MSIAAAALALARPFEYEGRTLKLRPLDFNAIAELGLWVEDRARLAAERGSRMERESQPWREALVKLAAAGEFEPGAQTFDQAISSRAGNRKVIALMLVMPPDEAEALSWEINADETPTKPDEEGNPTSTVRADVLTLCRELNSDPAAKKNQRIPRPATSNP